MDIDYASIERHLKPAIDDLMDRLGAMVEDDAKRYVPVDTSDLQRSIRRAVENGAFRVGSDLDYSVYVETGTKPHVIRPRNKKALWWPGALHPVAMVNHPGTAAQMYLKPALFTYREGS